MKRKPGRRLLFLLREIRTGANLPPTLHQIRLIPGKRLDGGNGVAPEREHERNLPPLCDASLREHLRDNLSALLRIPQLLPVRIAEESVGSLVHLAVVFDALILAGLDKVCMRVEELGAEHAGLYGGCFYTEAREFGVEAVADETESGLARAVEVAG